MVSSANKICNLIRGFLARRKTKTLFLNIPHVLKLSIHNAEKLKLPSSSVPDAYVRVNIVTGGIKAPSCYNTAKTKVISNANPQWNEDLRLSTTGLAHLVLNVFSKSVLSGDTFLGQVVYL